MVRLLAASMGISGEVNKQTLTLTRRCDEPPPRVEKARSTEERLRECGMSTLWEAFALGRSAALATQPPTGQPQMMVYSRARLCRSCPGSALEVALAVVYPDLGR